MKLEFSGLMFDGEESLKELFGDKFISYSNETNEIKYMRDGVETTFLLYPAGDEQRILVWVDRFESVCCFYYEEEVFTELEKTHVNEVASSKKLKETSFTELEERLFHIIESMV
jgi:hypothetical protein